MQYQYNIKRNQNRRRGFPLIRIVFAIAVVAFIGKFFLKGSNSANNNELQSATIIPPFPEIAKDIVPAVPNNDLLTYVVKSGDTFYGIMDKHDVPSSVAIEIYKKLNLLELTSLFPGDSLVFTKDTSGAIDKIDLLSRMRNWYKVSLDSNMVTAHKEPLSITTYICLLNGVLETSLSEEIFKYGVSDVITWKIADIFAWDINFFLDPRKGDTFQVIYEQKYAEGKFLEYGELLAAKYSNNGKVYYAFGFFDDDGRIRYYDINGKSVQKQFLKAPLRYSRISSKFTYNRKHPVLGIVRPHLGIDYAAPTGTPIYAAADGRVKFAGRRGGYGNLVILSHGSAYETWYGHLSSYGRGIRSGKVVKQSDVVGAVGATGMATGPHLDYRMKRNGAFVNPLNISMPSTESVSAEKKSTFELSKASYLASFDIRHSDQVGNFVLDIQGSMLEDTLIKNASNNDSDNKNGIDTKS